MDNVLIFSEDGLTVIGCDKTYSGEIVIPEGVEHIAEQTFVSCKAISIRIPNSVTSIGDMAFSECSSLTSVHISDIVAWCKIVFNMGSSNPLYYAQHLYLGEVEITDLVIPNSVTSIGNCAFCGCSRLTSVTIPSSVTSIGNWGFSDCTALTTVNIPNSVTSIGDSAFCGCSSLISVTIPSSVTSIGVGAFCGCSNLTTIVVEEGNTKYDSRNNCNAIIESSSNTLIAGCKNTMIPNSVTSIGEYAFDDCNGMTSIIIPSSVTSIGDHAFSGCSRLTSVNIPNSVTSIGNCAFSWCTGLTSITIPSNVTSIGSSAFSNCTSLTSITIHNNVTNIGDYLFAYCYKLKEIIIPKGTRKKFEEMLPYEKDKLVEQEQYPQESTKTRKLFLFFDTETTGLPSDWDAPSSDVTNWPRIVQISWIISNDRGQTISKHNYIVKPEGFSIPIELAKIHGITTERALKEGEKLNNILDYFLRDLQQVSYIVGHNISFDKNVVAAEIYRKGSEKLLDEIVIDKYVDMLETKPTICTMLSSTNYCRIPRYDNGYKWPKLSELYYKLFNKELVDAHDSSVDIQATFDCFWKLVELGVIASVDAEDTINGKETPIHHNKMRFTSFYFNSSIYNGYGEPTSDFIKRLYTREWKLFVSNETPQDLIFNYPDTLHVMDKGRGISGSYTLKDKDSILLSIEGESLYLHCVYYNEEIIIFQFDQSNEHLLLYQKHLVFSSDNDIRNYLNRVKQHVDTQRRNARKQREIEIKERADSLIKDITRTDVEISDKRVSTLKTEMKQLASILGSEEAEKYQSYIDNAVKENQKEKEEKALAVENSKRAKKERKAKLLVKIINWTITIVFIAVWLLSTFLHFFSEWEICYSILKWSAIISGICIWILLNFRGAFERFSDAKVLTGIFALFTIVLFAIYDYEYLSFKHGSSDKYLSRTVFHLFDGEAKRRIRNCINDSYDLRDLKMYLSDNKSGYYVEEAKGQLYYASDQLCRQAETLGDWKYIINNAPQEYKVDAEKNYARLDSFVWDNEELAYLNAKSLHTIEAYDKYLSRRFDNNKHCLEIDSLRVESKKFEDMMRRGEEALKRMIRSKHR